MDTLTNNAQRLFQLIERMRERQRSMFMVQLTNMNLSLSHMRMLHLLMHNDSLAMKELADKLQLTPPSVTALTRRLVEVGLVERQAHSEDSRVVLLALTEAGRTLHQQIHAEQLQHMRQLLSGLSLAEQALFLDLLDKATQPLESAHPSHCRLAENKNPA
jgi:DNA-binding MarR family transcriptional regulator